MYTLVKIPSLPSKQTFSLSALEFLKTKPFAEVLPKHDTHKCSKQILAKPKSTARANPTEIEFLKLHSSRQKVAAVAAT